MSKFPAPAPEYMGPVAHDNGNDNKPINHIVMHSTVSPCVKGQAAKTALFFRSEKSGGSAHYAVDPGTVIQCAFDSVECWGAPPLNRHALHVEMCEFPAAGMKRWDDEPHVLMFHRAVRLVAELCLAYNVPPWYVGPVLLRLRRRGVTTHASVSKAFKESTHWDPGGWPRRKFMRAVRADIKWLRAQAASRG